MGIPLGPSLAVGAGPWERRAVLWPARIGQRGGVLRALNLEGFCVLSLLTPKKTSSCKHTLASTESVCVYAFIISTSYAEAAAGAPGPGRASFRGAGFDLVYFTVPLSPSSDIFSMLTAID